MRKIDEAARSLWTQWSLFHACALREKKKHTESCYVTHLYQLQTGVKDILHNSVQAHFIFCHVHA